MIFVAFLWGCYIATHQPLILFIAIIWTVLWLISAGLED